MGILRALPAFSWVQGLGFRVWGLGFRVYLGFRVQGSGFRVQGLGFRVYIRVLERRKSAALVKNPERDILLGDSWVLISKVISTLRQEP